jgi:hypothetical protein
MKLIGDEKLFVDSLLWCQSETQRQAMPQLYFYLKLTCSVVIYILCFILVIADLVQSNTKSAITSMKLRD